MSERGKRRPLGLDRSIPLWLWYRTVQQVVGKVWAVLGGLRASGRDNVPERGGVILVANHLSYLDVFMLGLLLPRMLNYVARSTLFVGPLGLLIRSVGGFPIQRDGVGVQGLKETLKRLKAGGIVTFFPEGTRSSDGELGPLKPGLAALVAKAKVPVVPAALAGTFEAWPRGRPLFRFHPVHIHYGEPITPEEVAGRPHEEVMELIRERMLAAQREARARWDREFGPAPAIADAE